MGDKAFQGTSGRLLKCFFVVVLALLPAIMINGIANAAERMAVKADTVNVRSGPGLEHEELWRLEKYFPLLILEKKNGWCRFKDLDGDQGWINESLIDKTTTVVTKATNCNVRSGPSTDTAVVLTVSKGVPFKVLQKKGKWLEIQHADGDKGWIMETLVW